MKIAKDKQMHLAAGFLVGVVFGAVFQAPAAALLGAFLAGLAKEFWDWYKNKRAQKHGLPYPHKVEPMDVVWTGAGGFVAMLLYGLLIGTPVQAQSPSYNPSPFPCEPKDAAGTGSPLRNVALPDGNTILRWKCGDKHEWVGVRNGTKFSLTQDPKQVSLELRRLSVMHGKDGDRDGAYSRMGQFMRMLP
jgi:hypothetical protein